MSKVLSYVLKDACLKCGYWDKTQRHQYKCYTSKCPAKMRDDRISQAVHAYQEDYNRYD